MVDAITHVRSVIPIHQIPIKAVAAAALLLALLAACDWLQVAEPEASLEIVPDSVTLTHIGERFTFTVRDGAGAGRVWWSSRDPSVVGVDANGTVTARRVGVSFVSARDAHSADAALVRVRTVPAVLEAIGGAQQTTPGQSPLEPVGVRVLDAGGTPVADAAVRFEPGPGSGWVQPHEAQSDSTGVVMVEWTLGPGPGRQVLRAVSVEGGASVEIIATARDPDEAAASVEVRSGEDQWELPGRAVPEPVVVRVSDEVGRPVWGASVRFEPDAGSGRADPEVAVTDSLGLASAVWTLGPQQGAHRLTASVATEMAVAFEATAVSDEGVCNRTPVVSAEIARSAGVGSCAEVTEEALREVDILNLSRKGIRRLVSGDFAGLVALEVLHLSENGLVELPARVFEGLSRLRQLDLPGNQLTELPPGLLANLEALESLRFARNELTELPPDIFKDLWRLSNLSLSSNELTQLPRGIFKGLSGLEKLFLSWNRLAELPEDLFAGLSNLELLTIRGNQLTSLPEGIFSGLSRLGDLRVGANRLAELPLGLFWEIPNVHRVDLERNQLTQLPPGLFSETPALQRLFLDGNRLAELPPGIFDGLPELVRLDLTWNRLVELPQGIFAGTPRLAELSLDINELAELPRGVFAGLSELQWVTLDRNPGAPFAVRPEFARVDAGDLLAPGPARVAVRVPLGAPFAFDLPVSVQRGTISRGLVSMLPGDTMSAPFVVSGASAGEVAVHVGFGPTPRVTAAGHEGLELVRGEELVLFAESDNRSPVAHSPVPAHRMQAGGPPAEVALGDYFEDPDGDSLAYKVATTVAGVVEARVEDGMLRLEPRSVDTTEVEVTATDAGGLRATQRFLTWVVPVPDPDAFDIELYFEPGFTAEEEAAIRRAADRWREAVTGDLPDVPVHGSLEGYCWRGPDKPRVVGVIDDVLITMRLDAHLGRTVAFASTCGVREESGHAYVGGSTFDLWYLRNRSLEDLYETAMHEIGHVLGIGQWSYSSSPLAWRALLQGRDGDPHFAGPLAVEAFNAAGGEGYTGGKVPLEDGISILPIHWRRSVIPDDIMAPGSGPLLTAITLQALADLGHEVDLSKADPYTLPMAVQGHARAGAAEAEGGDAEVLADDIVEGPVVVVDRDGKVVRVIRP